MNLNKANAAISAAVKESEKLGVKMNIAVVDVGANLVAFVRMDGSLLGSVDIAMRKARTSALFNRPTGAIGGLSQPGGALYTIEHSNGGLISFPGGLPIHDDAGGNLIGAIGVSGSTIENDHKVAEVGVQAAVA